MKSKKHSLVAAIFALLLSLSLPAQVFEIGINGNSSVLFGDFAKQDLSLNSAGYSSASMGVGVDFHYYTKSNLGFGLRSSSVFYAMDRDEYEDDIIATLDVDNDNYDFTEAYGYASIGTEVGLSYLVNLSENFQLEPYFYVGVVALASPRTSVVYSHANFTYTYETKTSFFGGVSYAPGLRFKWNIQKHFGLNVFAEYQGRMFLEDDITSIKKSYNTLEIEEVEKLYAINAVTLGFGLTFSFGNGLADK